MFIDQFMNNGVPYLRLVESRRVTTKNSKLTSVKSVIMNLGPLSRFDDGEPDYLARLRQSYRDGKPIIDALLPYVEKREEQITLTFTSGSGECVSHPKLFADAILSAAFRDLGLTSLFGAIKRNSAIQYDLVDFARLVTFGRILNPGSKMATVRQNEDYQTPILSGEFNPDNIYDMLDLVYENRYRIYQTINKAISSHMHRDTSVIFYDVTNFYYETDLPDLDETDESGNVLRAGLRKMGVSKENRNQPIVQMGLFMDRSGIPIGVEEFPGNTLDHLTVRSSVQNIVQEMGYDRFVFVADRGMCNLKNNLFLIQQGDGYLVSKSIKKTMQSERKWILEEDGYKTDTACGGSKFRYKSRIMTRTGKDENGRPYSFQEKVLVYWSEHYYKRELAENKSFLAFLDKLAKNPASFRITAAQSRTMKKFMKKGVVNQETGEVLESSKLLPLVDWDKVNEWKQYMGYYQIVTSETEMEDKQIIATYHELSQIEDRFRTMKGTLETRPIFCRTPEHISAHLVMCAVALIVFSLIQKRIKDSGLVSAKPDQGWFAGLSGERLQRALNLWKVEELPRSYYRFCDTDDPDLKLVLDSFGVNLEPKLYTAGGLREIRRSIRLFG